MKIGILGPSPIPFARGGVESLLQGLLFHLDGSGVHQADLIKLPSRELSFWDLIETYRSFYELNLDHFDMIISVKYPTWMTQHSNHVIYMAHRLRGLYDTYPGLTSIDLSSESVTQGIYQAIENQKAQDFPKVLFSEMDRLRSFQGQVAPEEWRRLTQFPGSLIRAIVHALDNWALSPERIRKFSAISQTVIDRPGYFPGGVEVEAIFPPPFPQGYQLGDSQYFFTVSRLDGPKRIELLIEAMLKSRAPISFKIAGEGPAKRRLVELAGNDPRIEFLGFVSDHQLKELYANARAVLFSPRDEDFGLVTLEAMLSGKPVVTTTDSGGPSEIVEDGVTGFVVEPQVEALAKRLDELGTQPERAKAMGQEAFMSASRITWENVIQRLTGTINSKGTRRKRPKMAVFTTYPISPPRHGGQQRVYHLYRGLSSEFDVRVISLVDEYFPASDDMLAPHFRATALKIDPTLAKKIRRLEKQTGKGLFDVLLIEQHQSNQEFMLLAKETISESDFVVASHPFLFPVFEGIKGKIVCYDSHNIEWPMKMAYLGKDLQEYSDQVREVEAGCCARADTIWITSESDRATAETLYGTNPNKLLIVPNGVNAELVRFTTRDDREKLKRDLGIDVPVILFLASYHPPNVAAAEWLIESFSESPYLTLVAGSVANHFPESNRFGNVMFLNMVTDAEKKLLLQLADVAVNPVIQGGGTNLKTVEYVRAGIPTVSTAIGMRGLDILQPFVTVSELSEFRDAVETILSKYPGEEVLRRASTLAERDFGWKQIASKLISDLSSKGLV